MCYLEKNIKYKFIMVVLACMILCNCSDRKFNESKSSASGTNFKVSENEIRYSERTVGVDWLTNDSLVVVYSDDEVGRIVRRYVSDGKEELLSLIPALKNSVMLRRHPNKSEALGIASFQRDVPILLSWESKHDSIGTCFRRYPADAEWYVDGDADYIVGVEGVDVSEPGSLYLFARIESWKLVEELSPWFGEYGVPWGDVAVVPNNNKKHQVMITWTNRGAALPKSEEVDGIARYFVSPTGFVFRDVVELPADVFTYRGLVTRGSRILSLSVDSDGIGSIVCAGGPSVACPEDTIRVSGLDLGKTIDLRVSPDGRKLLVVSASLSDESFQIISFDVDNAEQ